MIRKLSDIIPVPTAHGVGEKHVLVDSNESSCSITQIAVTDLKRGEVAVAHVHPDMQEGFYVLDGELNVILDGKETVCGKDTFVYVDRCTWHEMIALQDSRIMTIGCVVEASRNKLYPMLFKPNRKILVWGTEDWSVSGVDGNESVIENGTWANYRLNDVIRRHPAEILGKKTATDYHNNLPLLTKIIDAKQDLSIQVHPDNAMAEREHHKSGKSEMWYILDAKPGSFLYAGLKQQVTPEILDYILNLLVIREEITTTESITMLRRQIDECDDLLIDTLAKRMRISREIGQYKKEHGMNIVQTSRYSEIIDKRGAQGSLCGIDPECIKRIFEAIHEESVNQQVQVMNRN